MGLLDILNGMQNGPRGQRQPTPPGSSSGGMSPLMMALLGLLAYKALKGGGLGNILGGGGAPGPTPLPPGSRTADSSGGLADILGGMLGGGAGRTGGGLGDLLGGMLGGASRDGMPGARPGAGSSGGGLGDILGGMLGGGGAGSALNNGLAQVLEDLQRSGQGRTAQSWVGTGQNAAIASDDLANALGADTIETLTRQTGLSRNELLDGLSQNLPEFVDRLTPDGRLPTEDEARRW
ncbi:MAG: DUF937 domain-containing protein [Hyphomicrobiales bacterium]|nr:DUF937 domain-containing protein [Hyphomicrobiales bacterium]